MIACRSLNLGALLQVCCHLRDDEWDQWRKLGGHDHVDQI